MREKRIQVFSLYSEWKKKIKSAPSFRPFQHLWVFQKNVAEKQLLCFSNEPFSLPSDRASLTKNKEKKLNSTSGLTARGSAIALLSNTQSRTHTHPYRYTQTLNREHRSSRWALSWLTVTHWWEQNSTHLFLFFFPLIEHQPLLTYHNVKQPLFLWTKPKRRPKWKSIHKISLRIFFPHFFS